MDNARLFPEGEPAGFPACQECQYLRTGSANACYICAWSRTERAERSRSCDTCGQEFLDSSWGDGQCRNSLCKWPQHQRYIEKIQPIALYKAPINQKIIAYKYYGKTGWALIFARVLVGFLAFHANSTGLVSELILPVPTFVGRGSHAKFAHTEKVIDDAAREDRLQRWPFDVGPERLLVQIGPKLASAGGDLEAKKASAEALFPLLRLTRPTDVQGKTVLLYDDVCTTGFSLNVIARFLKGYGAKSVKAVVMTRVPWSEKPL